MELGFTRVWLPFIYLYGMGGVFFLAGMAIIIGSKAMNLKFVLHKKWLRVLIFGFFWYMFIHFFFTMLATR